jgi:hypothetical protein
VRGLNQLSQVGWETDSDDTIKRVEVEIFQEPTKHTVDVPHLLKWIKQGANNPARADDERKATEAAWKVGSLNGSTTRKSIRWMRGALP